MGKTSKRGWREKVVDTYKINGRLQECYILPEGGGAVGGKQREAKEGDECLSRCMSP